MPDGTSRKKKPAKGIISVLNKLLILFVIIIAGLIALYVYLMIQDDRELDLSFQYEEYLKDQSSLDNSFTLQSGHSFAENLVVSDSAVYCDGVALSANYERGMLACIESNTSLFAQGIYEKVYPASITKIMTAIVAMKYGNMEDVVTITPEDLNLEEGSQVSDMVVGDTLTMEQLMNVLLVYSGNDAAMAISRTIAGSVEGFVDLMNQEAVSLGMTGTHFTNPHGLQDSEHYTTVYDIYLMLNEAYQYPLFREIIQQSSYTLTVTDATGTQKSWRLDSTDKYLTGEHTLPAGVKLLGGKTGTTSEAGACLALITQNEYGIPYISIIVNAENKTNLYNDMDQLLFQINL